MRDTLTKAVRAFTGADIPGHPEKPMAWRLAECAVALAAIVWLIALFLCLEPTP